MQHTGHHGISQESWDCSTSDMQIYTSTGSLQFTLPELRLICLGAILQKVKTRQLRRLCSRSDLSHSPPWDKMATEPVRPRAGLRQHIFLIIRLKLNKLISVPGQHKKQDHGRRTKSVGLFLAFQCIPQHFNGVEWIAIIFNKFEWLWIDFNEFHWSSMYLNEFQYSQWIGMDFNSW